MDGAAAPVAKIESVSAHSQQVLSVQIKKQNTPVEGHDTLPHWPTVGPSSYTLSLTDPVPF